MWKKQPKRVIFTLCINDYAPRIRKLTWPLIKRYAKKIDAKFVVISERRFPKWPVTYEKLQIHTLAQEMGLDWAIYIDSDVLIHPNSPDWTCHIAKDHVAHNTADFANNRWRYDQYFMRDGRNLGSCNWFAAASDWCLDLWHPLDDLTLEEAVQQIFPTQNEKNSRLIEPEHLIDDFTVSRNIAKYGLKFTALADLCKNWGYAQGNPWFWHQYGISEDQKAFEMQKVLKIWGLV